jgi:preprotein translocase subunit SecB
MSSPLQLDLLCFTNVSIQSNLTSDAEHINNHVGYISNVDPQNNRKWQVQVRVKMEGEGGKSPMYAGTVECAAKFTVAQDWPEEMIEKLVVVNGVGLLYSAIREMICNITSRGPWPMLILPSESFLEAYEAKKREATPKGNLSASA